MGRKAIFFDIDGTLWDEKFQIPDSTREAFCRLKENGHLTFICTGRTMSYIQDERLLSLGFDGIVAGCGTYVEKGKEVLFYKKIEPEVLKHTLGVLQPFHYPVVLEGREHLYVDEETFGDDPFLQVLKKSMIIQLLSTWQHQESMQSVKLVHSQSSRIHNSRNTKKVIQRCLKTRLVNQLVLDHMY